MQQALVDCGWYDYSLFYRADGFAVGVFQTDTAGFHEVGPTSWLLQRILKDKFRGGHRNLHAADSKYNIFCTMLGMFSHGQDSRQCKMAICDVEIHSSKRRSHRCSQGANTFLFFGCRLNMLPWLPQSPCTIPLPMISWRTVYQVPTSLALHFP